MNILMLARNIEFGGAIYIRDALNKYTDHNCYLCVSEEAPYNKRTDDVFLYKENRVTEITKKPDLALFIFDAFGSNMYFKYLEIIRPVWFVYFFSGTDYIRNRKSFNQLLPAIKNKTVFAMPDLKRFIDYSHQLLQPCEFTYSPDKYEEFTVCHSPGAKYRSDEKGSKMIEFVLDELGIRKSIISDMSHRDCLSEKAKCHVFIDKIGNHSNGVGKSGQESLYMGIPTICSMDDSEMGEHYKDIPVIHVADRETLKNELMMLRDNDRYYKAVADKTRRWSQYLSYKQTAEYINQTIMENIKETYGMV